MEFGAVLVVPQVQFKCFEWVEQYPLLVLRLVQRGLRQKNIPLDGSLLLDMRDEDESIGEMVYP